jgi:hypothetical protein
MPDATVSEPAIAAALAAGAIPAQKAGITGISCTLTPIQDGFAVTARFSTPDTPSDRALTVLEYPKEDIWIDGDKMTRTGGEVRLNAKLYDYSDLPLMIDRSKLRLTLLDQGRAIDIQGCPSP